MRSCFHFIICCVFCVSGFFNNSIAQKITPASHDTVTIMAVGDLMPGTNFPSADYLPPDDGKHIFHPVKELLQNADLTFGNLEGALLDSGGTVKKCQDMSKCYAFRIPEHYINYFTEAGFDLLNIANNHSGDFGNTGRTSTMKVLDAAGIYYAGLRSCPSVIFQKDGLTYGFCAFSPFTGTMDILQTDTAKAIVAHLDSLCDIVIVSIHAGAEGAAYRHVTRQTELFYDEDRGNMYEFSHAMIDAGADVILGHGPHVTRAAELYKNRFIAYSLGNFCTYARFNLKGSNGVAPAIKIFTNSKGEFLKARVYSIKQTGEGGPVPDDENTALKELIELTASDFPESPLTISPEGMIEIRR
jgi:poly-gamma-glutamate capsule biosynthesis protein CapA/YwtB (metallophosphatase superfamily)